MARRVGNRDVIVNQENANVHRNLKGDVHVPSRRAALEDVGNTLPVCNVTKKGNLLEKKAVKKNNDCFVKPKPVIRQESLLNKKALPIQNAQITSTQTQNKAQSGQSNIAKKAGNSNLNSKLLKSKSEISHSSKQLENVENIDSRDSDNPLAVSEYAIDIFNYLQKIELEYNLRQNFLSNSKSTPRMRSVLVNWLVEVHINFKLLEETLHLTISILDRYLQIDNSINRENLQLVGAASLFLASKYEEMYAPELSDFVYVCDDTFTKKEILKMELDIFKKLKFFLGKPFSLHFLRRFNKIAAVDDVCHSLGKYLLEICLLEYDLCHLQPSLQAAAACCLAKCILKDVSNPSDIWTATMVHYTNYKYSQIKLVMANLAAAVLRQEKSKFKMVKEKYQSSKLHNISSHPKLKGELILKIAEEATIKK